MMALSYLTVPDIVFDGIGEDSEGGLLNSIKGTRSNMCRFNKTGKL